jgi:hypothetical protein
MVLLRYRAPQNNRSNPAYSNRKLVENCEGDPIAIQVNLQMNAVLGPLWAICERQDLLQPTPSRGAIVFEQLLLMRRGSAVSGRSRESARR